MADDKPKKKGGVLKWILLLFILLLLGAAGGWYYFFSTLPGSRNAALSAGDAAARPAAKPAELKDVLPTKDLQPFLVNLSDPLGRRYIKLTFEVEMANAEVGAEIDRQGAKIRDTVIMLLSSKSYADLVPTENKLQLQNELVERINRVLGGPKITRVFFTDMVIQ